MQRAIGIIILGLILSGCATYPTSKVGQNYSSNDNYILIGLGNAGMNNRSVTIIAGEHCKKHDKYAFLYEYDWVQDADGVKAHVWCSKTYKATRLVKGKTRILHWTNYEKIKLTEEKPEKKKPKSGPDDNKVVAASMGSGFFVTRAGHLVTNHHVIEGCNVVKANILGKEIQTDIIAVDKSNDLAIIKAKMNPSKVFPVSNEDVSLLQDVIVAGFPLGKSVSAVIKTHKGSVTALAGFGDNYSNFQTDATINQGNSGGPIMNQKGNVVGVAVQLLPPDRAQNTFFGIKSSTLRTFAKSNSINFLTPNHQELSNEDLSKLITEATVFLECWMTVAKIKQMVAQAENRKAFYSEHK